MRDAIRARLIDQIDAVGERVFEPHAATKDDGFPFLVIRELTGAQTEDHLGMITPVEVWAETTRERYLDLDNLCDQVKAALDEQIVTDADGKRWYLQHTGEGTDALDELFGGITKQVTFDATDLSWLAGTTYAPDPVEAMRTWMAARWPILQTDPATWIPSAEAPAVYWRYAGTIRILEYYPTVTWVEIRLMGHILTTSPAKRLEWTRRIHEALVTTRNIPLSDGNPLYIEAAGADSSAHPIRNGQLTVIARMGLLVEEPDVATIEHAFVSGAGQTQEVV